MVVEATSYRRAHYGLEVSDLHLCSLSSQIVANVCLLVGRRIVGIEPTCPEPQSGTLTTKLYSP